VHEHHRAAGAQVLGGARADAVEQHAAVGARVDRPLRAVRRQRLVLSGEVGRVRGDRVEALAGDRGEQIAAQRAHAHTVEPRVDPDRRHRAARHVDRGDRPGAAARRRERDRAAPRAEVEHARAGAQLRAEVAGEQPRVRAGPEHARQRHDAHRHATYPRSARRQTPNAGRHPACPAPSTRPA
jgi:hypothetical protein